MLPSHSQLIEFSLIEKSVLTDWHGGGLTIQRGNIQSHSMPRIFYCWPTRASCPYKSVLNVERVVHNLNKPVHYLWHKTRHHWTMDYTHQLTLADSRPAASFLMSWYWWYWSLVCPIYNLYYDIMSSLYYHGGNVTPDPQDTLCVEGHSAFRKCV